MLDPRARDAAVTAAAELAAALPAAIDPSLDGIARVHPDLPGAAGALHSGCAGLAVFFAEAHRAWPTAGHGARAEALLERAFEHAASCPMRGGLHDGFVGIAWATTQVAAALALGDPAEALADVDDAIDAALADLAPACDLMSGIAGAAVYAHARADRALAARVAGWIDRVAIRDGAAVSWPSPGPRQYRGMAHGTCGIIGALAPLARGGDRHARAIITDAIAGLATEIGHDGWRAIRGDAAVGRAGWCHGALGAAACLASASDLLGDVGQQSLAALLAHRDPPEDDLSLCHGRAGAVHLTHRLAVSLGSAELAARAEHELRALLASRLPGAGIAGFVTTHPTRQLPPFDNAGLMIGAAGIGLALLSAGTGTFHWDACLGLGDAPAT